MKSKVLTGIAALALCSAMALPTLAGGGGGGGGGGGFGGGGGGGGGRGGRGGFANMNPQQMMDMRLQNIRTAMGTVPDDQWAVLSGKIQKVLTLEGYYNTGRNQMPGFGRGGMGGRGGRGGRFGGAGAAPDPANTVEGPVTDLDTLLQNQAASPDELKAKLTALRDARKKVLADLTAAQDDLQKVCDVHQEAVLVSLSILD